MNHDQAAIGALAYHVPDGRLTNEQLEREFPDWDAGMIERKTGIRERGIAAADECASDLAVAAAEKLFRQGRYRPEEIDFLLLCTQSPDYFLPASACLVHQRLGLRGDCGAFDINQGCSGYLYGLATAKAYIEAGLSRRVLLLTADTYSKYVEPGDRSLRTIFGDGAAATVVEARASDRELLGPFVFGTDGSGAPNLVVAGGAARRRAPGDPDRSAPEPAGGDPPRLYMNGPEIFNFTLGSVPSLFQQLLERAGVDRSAIDHYVFHQANRFMLENLRRKLQLPEDRFWIDLAEYGNTVSSTIPIALRDGTDRHVFKQGSRLMLLGFGVGYSWAGTLAEVTWDA